MMFSSVAKTLFASENVGNDHISKAKSSLTFFQQSHLSKIIRLQRALRKFLSLQKREMFKKHREEFQVINKITYISTKTIFLKHLCRLLLKKTKKN
jgi:transposase-like protein